jgi:2-keto-4-pentenoate hydratase/2-oxohepta-3-ene-1,7-dioic acid hydratase in catechol pathway
VKNRHCSRACARGEAETRKAAIASGRNYRAHAAEAAGPPPESPQVFLRLVNTLVAPNQPMVVQGFRAISITRASWLSSSASPAATSPNQMG